MKKFVISFILFSFSGIIYSQYSPTQEMVFEVIREQPDDNQGIGSERAVGDIIWSDDFSTPANWTATGPSGNYTEWGWSIGTAVHGWYFSMMGGDMGTSGNFARFVNGDPTIPNQIENGPFTLEYSTPIDVSGVIAPHLEFEQYGARFITLQGVQVSTDGGLSWSEVINNNDIEPLTTGGGSIYPKPQTRSVNISPYITGNPSNVTIRLYWDGALNGGSMNYAEYGWFVDNVRIVEGANYDVLVEKEYFRSGVGGTFYQDGLEYYIVPESQITNINFSALAFNDGDQTHTNVALNMDVDMGGSVYTNSSATANIPSLATDSLFATTPYVPADGIGDYLVTWYVAGSNTEEITSNDTIIDTISVTDKYYSRAEKVHQGNISNVASNQGNPFEIGNTMEIFNDALIHGAQVKINADPVNAGQLMYAVFYMWDTGSSDFIWVGQSNDVLIQNSDLGQYVDLPVDVPFEVAAGDILLVTAGHYGGSPAVTFATAQHTIDQTVLGYDGSHTLFSLLNPRAVMLNIEMTDYYFISQNTSICNGDSIQFGSTWYNSAGIYYDTLNTSGLDTIMEYNLTIDTPYENTVQVNICDGDSYTVGGSTYTTAGSYSDTLSMIAGACDSIIHTDLVIDPLPTDGVTESGDTLYADFQNGSATYQWVDCNNNNLPVLGATGSSWVPAWDGAFAVEITLGNCTLTTTCVLYGDNAVDLNELSIDFDVYPNPTTGNFGIIINNVKSDNYAFALLNAIGQYVVNNQSINGNQIELSDLDLSPGVYFVKVYNEETEAVKKLVVR